MWVFMRGYEAEVKTDLPTRWLFRIWGDNAS